MSVPDNLAAKRATLDERLHAMGRTLVAYSGGVDSAFLAWAAYKRLGADMMAVIADSPSLARTHLADAIVFAGEHAIPLEVIATTELDRPEYVRNDASRCFHCKDELFTVMDDFRRAHGFDSIAYGVIWDKPASACLSSRIEYGRPVTREALSVVEQGEDAIRALGFRQFRVRHHGEIVRIEIAREELSRALNPAMAAELTRIFKTLGFKFVTLDLEGFRSGSMNSLLSVDRLTRDR